MSVAEASGTAHGKVILLGEHAVVYGAPALAAGIDRGARAKAVRTAGEGPSFLTLGERTVAADPSGESELGRAFSALLGGDAGRVSVEASTELPPGGGLGSSAALGIAIARAVLGLGDEPPLLDEVVARATAWERVFHGNPSGIDTAAAAHGGCFLYSRGDGMHPIAPSAELRLAIGWSGAGSSTKLMVDSVARLRARRPEVVGRSIEGITSLVKNASLAIEAGDLAALGSLMDLNQMILAGLMLSTESLEAMCALARSAGALGAKLTGAGGGGSVIALLPSPPLPSPPHAASDAVAERVLEAWRGAGYSGFVARIPAVGGPS